MKIPDKTAKAFYSDSKLTICVKVDKDRKITGFDINDKTVKVTGGKILAAWKKVEQQINKTV